MYHVFLANNYFSNLMVFHLKTIIITQNKLLLFKTLFKCLPLYPMLMFLLLQNKTDSKKKPKSLFAQQMSRMSAGDLGLVVTEKKQQPHVDMEGKEPGCQVLPTINQFLYQCYDFKKISTDI